MVARPRDLINGRIYLTRVVYVQLDPTTKLLESEGGSDISDASDKSDLGPMSRL
jgi:hypothetical protein